MKKFKVDFQQGCKGDHLGFPIGMILAIFIYKSPLCFRLSFKSVGLSVQENKRKIDIQVGHHDGHLGFLIGTISAIFDLQVTPML